MFMFSLVDKHNVNDEDNLYNPPGGNHDHPEGNHGHPSCVAPSTRDFGNSDHPKLIMTTPRNLCASQMGIKGGVYNEKV